jgi:hypothetical protein
LKDLSTFDTVEDFWAWVNNTVARADLSPAVFSTTYVQQAL